MKIAITGSNCFLGLSLTKFFKNKGYEIMEINRKKKFDLENEIPFNFKDRKVDVLIHLAHNYSSKSFEVNLNGTKKLFENAIKNKIKKLFFISSLSSHKDAKSIYGKTKFKIEKFCLKKKIIIIRPGLIFGYKLDKKLSLLKKINSYLPVLPYFENKSNFIYSVSIDELTFILNKILKKKNNVKIYNIFNRKKIFFIDLIRVNKSQKIKIKLPFFLFYYSAHLISKLIYFKSVDSFLGILNNRINYSSIGEKNFYTKKSLIDKIRN